MIVNMFSEILKKWRTTLFFTITFFVLILAMIFAAVIYLSSYFDEGIIVSASGRKTLNFRVFYLENDIFDENPIPSNLNFLMSYTDFIEIENSFAVDFSEEKDIYYSYNAEMRMVIRPMGADGHQIVFEEIFPLSEINGQATATRLYFNAEDNGAPGGVYRIYPKDHLELYFNFVEDQARQMEAENVIARGIRGFSADLLVNFTYTIRAPEFGLNEVVTQGYRIPLTTEIFTLDTTGVSSFDWRDDITVRDDITLTTAILIALVFALSVLGFFYNLKKLLTADINPQRQKVKGILKKYAYEIVVYNEPIDLTEYAIKTVKEFSDLLKLAVNLNKHIMCYQDENHSEFVVILDEFACFCAIDYDERGSGKYGSDKYGLDKYRSDKYGSDKYGSDKRGPGDDMAKALEEIVNKEVTNKEVLNKEIMKKGMAKKETVKKRDGVKTLKK